MQAQFLTKLKTSAAIVAIMGASLVAGDSVINAIAGGEKGVGDKKDAKPSVDSAAGNRSKNNLKLIGLAMHQYHDVMKGFPPPAMKDKNDKNLLSWRVALLPHLNEAKLYQQFNLDEPWDSEQNKKLIAKMPEVFALPGIKTKEPGQTHYQVFVGKQTVFEPLKDTKKPGANVKIAQITDGTSLTIMVVEAAEPVTWTKPDDLPFDPKGSLPRLGVYGDVINALFCDRAVHTFRKKLDKGTLRALIRATVDR